MRIRPVLAVLLLALASQTACANRDDSNEASKGVALKVVNGGFEEKAAVDAIPGWRSVQHAGDKSYTQSVDRKGVAKGKQSLKFEQILEQHYGMLVQDVPITPDMIGKTVELSAMLKTLDVKEPGYNLWMGFYDRSPSLISHLESELIHGNTPWKQHQLAGTIPPGTTYIQIALHMFDHSVDGGTGWADEVRLTLLDAASENAPAKP